MQRSTWALKLSYDGSGFAGWQRQGARPSVQGAVEDALARLAGEQLRVDGAARTDAGVHAEAQVASFSTRRELDISALEMLRAPNVRVVAAARAHRSFHARASASGKVNRYAYAWGAPRERAFFLGRDAVPSWARAREALRALAALGEISGLASPSSRPRPAPPLQAWSLDEDDGGAVLEVRAAAFRKHEVRNLAGHLAAIALGLAAPGTLAALAAGHRPWRGATAPGAGLTLSSVIYPREIDPFTSCAAEPGPAPRSGDLSGTAPDRR
jgi:tRNA pseudouridine38-40 synthase